MAESHCNAQNAIEEEEDYTILEDSDYDEFDSNDSNDSGDDPTFVDDLDRFQSNFSNLSISSRSNLIDRKYAESNLDDEIAPKRIKDMKDLEEIQKVIDSFKITEELKQKTITNKPLIKDINDVIILAGGLVEKLKVEQCKVYLRKHGLRLTGKKDTLVQRIKEHSEILKGGGENKFPPSSFVLNCKGDACMGDIVMFEQTVYEGYNIVSRSAAAPPCGKRTVAGRIVKESYGAAKQQHTFTVEVLWSKGHKPLPPLHPLLIKGRNLYKLNTLRQRWEDESERQRVLSEKHCRGSLARSNREARIQEKELKKTLKGIRVCPRERQPIRQEKNHMHATGHISNCDSKTLGSKAQKQHIVAKKVQQTTKDQNLKVPEEYKENLYAGLPISQPLRQNKPNIPASDAYASSRVCLANKDQNSSLSHIPPANFQYTTLGSHYGFSDKAQQVHHHPRHQHHSVQTVVKPQPFQQKTSSTSTCNFFQKPNSCFSEIENFTTSVPSNLAFSDKSQHPQNQLLVSNTSLHNSYGRFHPREMQQLCWHYPKGKCNYGTRCKFLHVSSRNYDQF